MAGGAWGDVGAPGGAWGDAVICYATTTNTRRNRDALMASGWRLLFSAATPGAFVPGWRYALDNGAWSAHTGAVPWSDERFMSALVELGPGADWVAVPDVVGDGAATLALLDRWLPIVLEHARRALIVVQDGMAPDDVRHLLGPYVGIAIGGSTEWKIAQLAGDVWGPLCRAAGAWLHALRVNTGIRIDLAAAAGCTSFDGTSATRFAVNAPKLAARAAQRGLWGDSCVMS